jgi:hypothetical protein
VANVDALREVEGSDQGGEVVGVRIDMVMVLMA